MKSRFLELSPRGQSMVKYASWAVVFLTSIIISITGENEHLEILNQLISVLFFTALVFGILTIKWTKKKDTVDELKHSTMTMTNTDKNYKDVFPMYLENHILKWAYNIQLAFPQNYSKVNVADSENIILDEEFDNEFDSEAIAVYKDDTKLGYLYKGTIKDMVKKYFFKREDFKPAMIVNKVDEENALIEIALAFYKYIDLENSQKTKMINAKISNDYNKEEYVGRLSALEDLKVNDILEIEEDYDDGYLLLDNTYNEVGRLDKNASAKLDELSDNRYVICKVDEIGNELDDNIVKLKVYLVDKYF
ncbi:MAG: hypothetical protein ACOCQ4_03210 [bacterium]